MSGKCANIVSTLRNTFNSGRTKSIKWRKTQLSSFLTALETNHQKFCEVLAADASKPKYEATIAEFVYLTGEIRDALDNIEEWAKPKRAQKTFISMMSEIYIEPEPLGVALIIGTWNYPFMLSLGPLISAIAAGNCAIVKPSELTPNSAAFMEQLVRESLDEDAFRVINGDASIAKELLECRFDHIFFTGGTRVGRSVMEAAAKHLTPVTLELGGKCPVFIDSNVDYDVVANRLAWAKWMNCGQTCLAPDYVITTQDVEPKLISSLKRALKDLYGDDVENNKDYARIAHDAHFSRLQDLVRASEAKIVVGGKCDQPTRYIAPTIVADVSPNDEVMKDEIFGPILPIMTVENYDEAIRYINMNEKPLALYLFTNRKELTDLFRTTTSSGAFMVNDLLVQASILSLPFGGVGQSGMGVYHGKFGFDTLSHAKPCCVAQLSMESFNVVRYPPYSEEKISVARFVTDTEASLSARLWKPLIWAYIFVIFLLRLATLPKRHRRT